MSKNHLTHADLKKQGLKLSKYEAQDLHSHINRIAQHGGDEPEVIYPGEEPKEEEKPKKGASKVDGKSESINVFDLPETDDPEDGGSDEIASDKLVWEYNAGEDGWCVVNSKNLDEKGNLTGPALECYKFHESHPDEENGGNCAKYWFRQIPASQVGWGDSTGNSKIFLDFMDQNDIDLMMSESTSDHISSKSETSDQPSDEEPESQKNDGAPKKRGRQPKAK